MFEINSSYLIKLMVYFQVTSIYIIVLVFVFKMYSLINGGRKKEVILRNHKRKEKNLMLEFY